MRRSAAPASATVSLPAPIRGWIEDENLARNGGMGCSVCENWFPLQSTIRVRGGALRMASIGEPCLSLVGYRAGGAEKLFAASGTRLYDVSALDDTPPLPAWTQLTSGRWSSTQMTGPGGQTYLLMVNGSDPAMYFDGTSWLPILGTGVYRLNYDAETADFVIGGTLTGGTSGATATLRGYVPATATTGALYLTGIIGTFQDNEIVSAATGRATANGTPALASSIVITGVSTADLSHIWVHNNRVWAVEQGTLRAWYLEVDSFGGTATEFSLAGVFAQGGSLLFGATWSGDSGSGMADRNVFVTDQGEIAVYEGIDPSDSETWAKVGTYSVGRPVSAQTIKAGGDLLIATADGIVPLSQIVVKDPAALSTAAITRAIEPVWRRVVRSNSGDKPFQLLKWQRESMGVIGFPHRQEVYVVNLQTGAWAKWTGHDAQCLALYRDLAYFADSTGAIFQIEGTGADGGLPYVARLSLLPDQLRADGAYKSVLQARATFRSLAPFTAKLSVAMDYGREFPPAPPAVLDASSPALWDIGQWDVARWDDAPDSEQRVTATTRWRSIGRSGVAASPQVQITCGSDRKPDAELVELTLLYQVGGTVV